MSRLLLAVIVVFVGCARLEAQASVDSIALGNEYVMEKTEFENARAHPGRAFVKCFKPELLSIALNDFGFDRLSKEHNAECFVRVELRKERHLYGTFRRALPLEGCQERAASWKKIFAGADKVCLSGSMPLKETAKDGKREYSWSYECIWSDKGADSYAVSGCGGKHLVHSSE